MYTKHTILLAVIACQLIISDHVKGMIFDRKNLEDTNNEEQSGDISTGENILKCCINEITGLSLCYTSKAEPTGFSWTTCSVTSDEKLVKRSLRKKRAATACCTGSDGVEHCFSDPKQAYAKCGEKGYEGGDGDGDGDGGYEVDANKGGTGDDGSRGGGGRIRGFGPGGPGGGDYERGRRGGRGGHGGRGPGK